LKSKDIILANIRHNNPPRPGLDFDRGRQSDMCFASFEPHAYVQKRWTEGNVEYYVAVVRPGRILFEVGGLEGPEAVACLHQCAYKFSIATKVIARHPSETGEQI